jgi:hypothetical protein
VYRFPVTGDLAVTFAGMPRALTLFSTRRANAHEV